MSPVSEIEAIAAFDSALSQLDDSAARDRVLKWAWDKFSSKPAPSAEPPHEAGKPIRVKSAKAKKVKAKTKSVSKSKSSLSIVKDLKLNPDGKKSFKDFVSEKQPSTNQQKCTVAVYYLQYEIGIEGITFNHIYTCYKDVNWRITDLYNILLLTASRKGWVDTSHTENIKITPHGENLVEHDLPHKTKGK